MDDRRVFEGKVMISRDGKFSGELVVERTIVRGTRISLDGEIKLDTAHRERSIEVKSNFVRSPRNLEHQIRNDRLSQ